MIFTSAASASKDVDEAVEELASRIHGDLGLAGVDLAVVFYSPHFAPAAGILGRSLKAALRPGVLLGCMGEGVIGGGHEIERRPAITVTAGRLPGVAMKPIEFSAGGWSSLLGDMEAFHEAVGASDETRLFILLADPFSTPMEPLLDAFNTAYPGIPMIGGMASGAPRPRTESLLMGDRALAGGAVAVALEGRIQADVIVSQGCRPIGRAFTVTSADENVIFSLEGDPPLHRIQEIINDLDEADRTVLENGLFVGRAMAPRDEHLGRGSFLIRGVMGVDRESGAVAVGDQIREGETVQFHLRDANTAREDLELMLTPQTILEKPRGGLLFSCNGRGIRLFDHPDGDVGTVLNLLGKLQIGGFFCAGEIGPVGGRNFLHGHTACLALFRPSAP